MFITSIQEENIDIQNYLIKRRLLAQYKKEKQKILSGQKNTLKLRQPKSLWLYYFRINKQFRAYCILRWTALIVFKIDNHQNG